MVAATVSCIAPDCGLGLGCWALGFTSLVGPLGWLVVFWTCCSGFLAAVPCLWLVVLLLAASSIGKLFTLTAVVTVHNLDSLTV